jgi:hypothetical protein
MIKNFQIDPEISRAETLPGDVYCNPVYPNATLQIGVAKSKEDSFALPEGHPDHGSDIAAFYYWLFSNLMMNFYPWGVSVNVVYPLGPERTKVSIPQLRLGQRSTIKRCRRRSAPRGKWRTKK